MKTSTNDNKMKAKLMKDGSVLKYMCGFSAAGEGCAGGGAVLLFAGILLGFFMSAADFGMPQALVAGGICVWPGNAVLPAKFMICKETCHRMLTNSLYAKQCPA